MQICIRSTKIDTRCVRAFKEMIKRHHTKGSHMRVRKHVRTGTKSTAVQRGFINY